jgi:outer membrane immunogenic protein
MLRLLNQIESDTMQYLCFLRTLRILIGGRPARTPQDLASRHNRTASAKGGDASRSNRAGACSAPRVPHRTGFHPGMRRARTPLAGASASRMSATIVKNPTAIGSGLLLALMTLGARPAVAADLARPAPLKASPRSVAAAPFDWSGPYLGGHIGYLWGRTRVTDNDILSEPGSQTNGVIGGVLLGYNWQTGPLVFGLESDFGWTHAQGTGTSPPPPPPPPPSSPPPAAPPIATLTTHAPNHYTINWTSHVRGRLGYAFGNWLVFAAGGLALSDLDFQEGSVTTTTISSSGGRYFGWSVGGGVEWTVTRNLLARIEYAYDDFGHKDYTGVTGDTYRVSLIGQSLRFALSWKFDPVGARP